MIKAIKYSATTCCERTLFKLSEYPILYNTYVGCLCVTSHRHRGHLETALPFTVPCEGREAR